MQTCDQTTLSLVQTSPPIYVLLDELGNLIGAGSADVLEVVLAMSQRCARAVDSDRPMTHVGSNE